MKNQIKFFAIFGFFVCLAISVVLYYCEIGNTPVENPDVQFGYNGTANSFKHGQTADTTELAYIEVQYCDTFSVRFYYNMLEPGSFDWLMGGEIFTDTLLPSNIKCIANHSAVVLKDARFTFQLVEKDSMDVYHYELFTGDGDTIIQEYPWDEYELYDVVTCCKPHNDEE